MITVYLINLDRDTAKLKEADRQLARHGIEYTRFRGFDGTAPDDRDVAAGYKPNTVCSNVLCSKGVIGCARSHMALWTMCAHQTDPWLILEDDIVLADGFVDVLAEVEVFVRRSNLPDLIVNMACIGPLTGGPEVARVTPGYALVKSVFPLGLGSYVLSPSAARTLVRELRAITYHIDFEMASLNLFGYIHVLSVSPTPASTHRLNTSIGTQHRRSLFLGWSHTLLWYANIPVLRFASFYTCFLVVVLAVLVIGRCYWLAAVFALELAVFLS
jgi:GR25 family glycosyltransferase involved in LPS biosynthesis